ncbi:hypothetical protein chiPu_0023371, partial [Chiloscyllium punctatum]|nr:hypothetical protein [Chiloscyllium punctatum]
MIPRVNQFDLPSQSLHHEVNEGQEFYQEIGSNIKEAENLMERMRDCGQKPIAQLAQYMESLKHLRHRWCRVNQEIHN